jgi:hypothetical protein
MVIKDWKKVLPDLLTWKKVNGHGIIDIFKMRKQYVVEIGTKKGVTHTYFKTKVHALNFAKRYMKLKKVI